MQRGINPQNFTQEIYFLICEVCEIQDIVFTPQETFYYIMVHVRLFVQSDLKVN